MKRRGLLLDRDGIINVDRGFVGKREDFEFAPGLFPFLRAAQDAGFRLAILTNQSGVARAFYTEEDYNKLTAWMLSVFVKQGITIDLVLQCFEMKEGTVPRYARESFWRKPSPGMVLEVIQRLELDPARSAFLGDNVRDMEAAQAGGIKHCLYMPGEAKETPPGSVGVKNFEEVLKILRKI